VREDYEDEVEPESEKAMPKLFTPETMKDEYHAAFEKQIHNWAFRADIIDIVSKTRETNPDVYMNLATLANDYPNYAFVLGVRIYLDAKGVE
jgi:hypothetical protein